MEKETFDAAYALAAYESARAALAALSEESQNAHGTAAALLAAEDAARSAVPALRYALAPALSLLDEAETAGI